MAIHELATMLAAGVSMADAVEAQERGARHPKLITALQAMANGLRQGNPFPWCWRAPASTCRAMYINWWRPAR